MEFKDFKPDELVGKTVLYEYGQTYSSSYNKAIKTIERVTKTAFEISGCPGFLFLLTSGNRKGLNSRQDMATHSVCYLITEEQANEYRKEWNTKRAIKLLRDTITEKLPDLSHEQLLAINKIVSDEK